MPAILSHHLFGRALLARENNSAFMTRDARDAFLLGNQGPDPLFYATRTPALVRIKTLGSRMHHEHIEEYLQTWREMLDCFKTEEYLYEVLQAYVYGFLCHYALDKAVHPLVYFYEEALCGAGIKGLGHEASSFVHGQIESDLDVYLLYKLTGRTLEEYRIPQQVLFANNAVLSHVDLLYGTVAPLFALKVPRKVYTRSLKNMRTVVHLLYSPGGTKRDILGRAERLVRPHSLLQAMSHRPEAVHDTWYANEERQSWLHRDARSESKQSFGELFDTAFEAAESCIELFAAGAPAAEITKGQDFASQKTSQERA